MMNSLFEHCKCGDISALILFRYVLLGIVVEVNVSPAYDGWSMVCGDRGMDGKLTLPFNFYVWGRFWKGE
jgi:hypothetical protein